MVLFAEGAYVVDEQLASLRTHQQVGFTDVCANEAPIFRLELQERLSRRRDGLEPQQLRVHKLRAVL